jgi:3-dehydroquinate synthase
MIPKEKIIDFQERIRVDVSNGGDRSYDVIVDFGILDKIGEEVNNLNIGKDIFIVTDTKVGPLYLQRVIKSFKSAGFGDIEPVQVPEGETSKTYEKSSELIDKLAEFDANQDKSVVVVGLGGGVVGDLAGFVAGTYRRGLNYIQISTTLLGQVDCGLGGKVGVNHKSGKNLIGMFYQPKLVFMDLNVLETLDMREMRSGFAEVIKYGMIADCDMFEYIEKHCKQILSLQPDHLKHIIHVCVKIKARITNQDERDDKGIRIILNFGHTIGHAIEAASNYEVYTHGEALSVGMLCASEISCYLGYSNDKDYLRLDNIIGKVGLPKKIKKCSLEEIIKAMKHDKKFVNGVNRFVLSTTIGNHRIEEDIDEGLIKNVIQKRMTK